MRLLAPLWLGAVLALAGGDPAAIQGELNRLGGVMRSLETRATALEVVRDESRRPEIQGWIARLAADGDGVASQQRSVAAQIAELGSPTQDLVKPLSDGNAALTERLARLRDRLTALGAAWGLPAPDGSLADSAVRELARPTKVPPKLDVATPRFGDKIPGESPDGSVLADPGGRPAPALTGPRGAPDRPATIPAPARPWAAAIEEQGRGGFFSGCSSKAGHWRRSAEDIRREEQAYEGVATRRSAGQTETLGDPVARGALVHRQNGNTCSIVAQMQILKAYGKLPPGDPAQQETQLYEEASRKGYFKGSREHGTTPWQFVGALLQDRGLLVSKRVGVADEELYAVLEKGKPVIVDCSSMYLWYNPSFRGGGHTIVLTGMERDKATKQPLGVYLNDSSGGPYHAAGRFMPIADFLKAWHAAGSQFVEVQ